MEKSRQKLGKKKRDEDKSPEANEVAKRR